MCSENRMCFWLRKGMKYGHVFSLSGMKVIFSYIKAGYFRIGKIIKDKLNAYRQLERKKILLCVAELAKTE